MLFLREQCERLLCKIQACCSVPEISLGSTSSPEDVFHIPKHPREGTTDDEGEGSFSDNRHEITISITFQDPDFLVLTSTSPHPIT